MKRRTEHEEIWGDIPRLPDEVPLENEQKEEKALRQRDSVPEESDIYGDVPNVPEELKQDPELRGPETLKKAVGEMGTVEILARLRSEFEERIIGEQLPVDEWMAVCEEMLEKHPEAKPYEEIFKQSIQASELAHKLVNEKWGKAERFAGINRKDRGAPMNAQADEKRARSLFRLCFAEDPRGRVIADKGQTAIYFTLEERDYERAFIHDVNYQGFGTMNRSQKIHAEKTSGVLKNDKKIPHVILLRGGFSSKGIDQIPQPEIIVFMKHEREHAINARIERGRNDALVRFRLGQRDLPEAIGKRLDSWEEEAIPIERTAKDEILAKSAEAEARLEFSELIKSRGEESLFDSDEFWKNVRKSLTDPEGFYYQYYLEHYKPTETEQMRYSDSTNKAVDAYMRLRTLYMNEPSPDRITRNILEQFPLHRWSAVVRLLEMHHREKEAAS